MFQRTGVGRSGTETPFLVAASFEDAGLTESVNGLWKSLGVELKGDEDKS